MMYTFAFCVLVCCRVASVWTRDALAASFEAHRRARASVGMTFPLEFNRFNKSCCPTLCWRQAKVAVTEQSVAASLSLEVFRESRMEDFITTKQTLP